MTKGWNFPWSFSMKKRMTGKVTVTTTTLEMVEKMFMIFSLELPIQARIISGILPTVLSNQVCACS